MDDDDRTVELMESAGERWIDRVYDVQTSTYYVPDPRSLPDQIRWAHEHGWTGKGLVIAVIDSGVMLSHPLISRSLIQAVDFTGEGLEDRNGHGTMVALLSLAANPDASIISVKVIDAEGRGKEKHLSDGLTWCAQNRDFFKIDGINLSAGVFHKKWGFWDCKGDCDVCRAAAFASSEDILITAAAGNDGPDQIPCPQKIGMRGGVITVGAKNRQTGRVADYSGRGMFFADTGFPLVPLSED